MERQRFGGVGKVEEESAKLKRDMEEQSKLNELEGAWQPCAKFAAAVSKSWQGLSCRAHASSCTFCTHVA